MRSFLTGALLSFLLLAAPSAEADSLDPWGIPGAADRLGPRVPVIFIHGYGVPNWLTWTALKSRLAAGFRTDPAVHGRVKPYLYSYSRRVPYPQVGRDLAARLRQEFPGVPRFLLVTSSAGALAGRFAFLEPDLRDRLGGMITIVAPHHGAIGASLLFANENFRRELGEDHWSTIEDTRVEQGWHSQPETIYSLGTDNLGPPGPDGEPTDLIDPETLARWGVPVNRELRALNLSGLHVDRMHVHQGSNTGFSAGEISTERILFGDLRERQRAIVEAVSGISDSDPIVPLYSGTFAHSYGGEPASVTIYEGLGHHGSILGGELSRNVAGQLRELAGEVGPPIQPVEAPYFLGMGDSGAYGFDPLMP